MLSRDQQFLSGGRMMRMAFIWEMMLRGCRACCKVTVVAKGAGQDISYQYFGPSTLGAGEAAGEEANWEVLRRP